MYILGNSFWIKVWMISMKKIQKQKPEHAALKNGGK